MVGRPGNVQNAYATQLERGLSVTDQRNRLVASTVYEPEPISLRDRALNALFNNWKVSIDLYRRLGAADQCDHGR